MFRTVILAALALACLSLPAEAYHRYKHKHHRHHQHHQFPGYGGTLGCASTDIMRPCGMFEVGSPGARQQAMPVGLMNLMETGAGRLARPARYIAGRLICAVNVGSALAERGIKGTGSALALSYLHWGRSSPPVPGAVAVSGRRGGGHVAIVSRLEGGQVYVWNPSSGGRGWREVAYHHRALSYRVPG